MCLVGDTQDKVRSIHVVPVAHHSSCLQSCTVQRPVWPLAKHMTNCELKVIKKTKNSRGRSRQRRRAGSGRNQRKRWRKRRLKEKKETRLNRSAITPPYLLVPAFSHKCHRSFSLFFHPPFLAASPHFLYQLFTHLFHFWSAHFCIILFLSASLTIFSSLSYKP